MIPRAKISAAVAATLMLSVALSAQTPAGVSCTARPIGDDANSAHPVCEVRAVVTRGPYLHAPTDSSATITWMTDLPSRAKVTFGTNGQLTHSAYSVSNGLVNVGTLHTVRISGLKPGQLYDYRVLNTPILDLPAYWPKTGLESQSDIFHFTTFDTRKSTVRFVSISDTHEDTVRIAMLMKRINFDSLDFLVNTGDAFNGVQSEAQLWDRWLSPLINNGIKQSTPLIFARGNHDTRGPFAREIARYVPIEENRFYYARDIGPVHLLIVDTGEDKPDSTQVYAELNRMDEYRRDELVWFKQHSETSRRAKAAPFRVVVMHQPSWGWGWKSPASDSARAAWDKAANEAGVDLVIAGHTHRFSLTPAGTNGNKYPVLVVGQDQVANVVASATEMRVQVIGKDGKEVSNFRVLRRAK